MKLVTDKIDKWKRWMRALSKIVDDVTLSITQEGVHHKSRDPSKASMISINFYKSSFKEYSLDRSRNIALDVDRFSKIVNTAGSSDSMTLTLDDNESELIVILEDGNKRKFSIPILSTTTEDIDDPKNLDFTTEVKTSARGILEDLKNVELIGERFVLEGTESEITISSSGGQGTYTSSKSKEDLKEMNTSHSSRSVYQIDLLEKVLSSLSKSADITLRFGEDNPIEVVSGDDDTTLRYLLAPIVRNN